MTRKNVSILTLLILAVKLFCLSEMCLAATKPISPQARKSILDLRSADFSNNFVNLKGEWKFYWKILKESTTPNQRFQYTLVPGLWKDITWLGKPIPSQGFATYELTILLPKGREQLGLKIPDMYSAYALYANGMLMAKNGNPGTSIQTTTPYWTTQVKPLLPTDTLHLKLFISNFHHSKGGVSKPIQIGVFNELQAESNLDHAFDFLLTGCMLMGGLYFLGLYLLGRHDKSTLYFALFCFCYSYRIIGGGDYALQQIFPFLSWQFAIHCEYISLFLAVAMFALYTKNLYPEDTPSVIIYCMAGICFALALITLVSPPILFSQIINPFLLTLLFYIGFATRIYWKAYKNKRIGAPYALLSTIGIFIIFITLILEYYDIASPHQLLLFIGYLAFFFFQSVILSFRFAFTLQKAKEDAELGLKTKGEFLSTMSHEIRTPLNAVIGMTHLLIKEEPREDQLPQLNALLFSAENLLAIVNDILDFSALEDGKIKFVNNPINVSQIAQKLVSNYQTAASQANIDLILKIDPALHHILSGDITRLYQILGNLVQNAIKFTKQGWVKLEIVVIKKEHDKLFLQFSVEDTGIGIPKEKQSLIFERFTQIDSSKSRGFGGTGLGLAITKRMLQLQGSELKLTSEVDKGSNFYFTLAFPIVEELKVAPIVEHISDEKRLDNVKILIVEDNKMNVLVVKNFLKRWGAEADVAYNGQEALEKLDSSKHQLILMDLHMPVMDGYEATKQIREINNVIPIIALTASLALEAEERIFSIGINDIVRKPFDPERLLSVILEQTKAENSTK